MRRSQPLLGTFVTITAYSSDWEGLNSAISAAFEEFRKVDAIMSIHRPDSELSRLNVSAPVEPVRVSPELFEAIAAAKKVWRESDGSFDATVRGLADLWGFIWKREYRLPKEEELQGALDHTGFRFVELNPQTQSIRFLKEGISIDLGGIGKGWAVDRAIEKLRSLGVTNAMVKAGGDLRVSGTPPGETFWTVQLEDPNKKGARIAVRLNDAALSTSGDYENFFEHEGRRYSHILDPRTGMPVAEAASCTVIAPTCTESDAWATACMVYGADKSLKDFGSRYEIRFVLRTGRSGEVLKTKQTAAFPLLDGAIDRQ